MDLNQIRHEIIAHSTNSWATPWDTCRSMPQRLLPGSSSSAKPLGPKRSAAESRGATQAVRRCGPGSESATSSSTIRTGSHCCRWTSTTPVKAPTATFLPERPSPRSGQIEVLRAHVPTTPTTLSAASFGTPTVVWTEEPNCPSGTPSSETVRCGAVNTGAYVAVAPGGDSYLAWERNIDSNLFNGDPYVYLHAARIPATGTHPAPGGSSHPVIITTGQPGNGAGGVKSLDTDLIPGYSRGTGNDFPRLAVDPAAGRIVFVWNDASHHPLGNIWLRTAALNLGHLDPITRVDDGATYALHFLPAVSIRTDGTICTSWYDRRRGGATLVAVPRPLEQRVVSRGEGRRQEHAHPTAHPVHGDGPAFDGRRDIQSEASVELGRGVEVAHLEHDHRKLDLHTPKVSTPFVGGERDGPRLAPHRGRFGCGDEYRSSTADEAARQRVDP